MTQLYRVICLCIVLSTLMVTQCKRRESKAKVKSAVAIVALQNLEDSKNFPVLNSLVNWFKEKKSVNEVKMAQTGGWISFFKQFFSYDEDNLAVLYSYLDIQTQRVDQLTKLYNQKKWSELLTLLSVEYEELIDIALVIGLDDEQFKHFRLQTLDHLATLLYNIRYSRLDVFNNLTYKYKTQFHALVSSILGSKTKNISSLENYLYDEKDVIIKALLQKYLNDASAFNKDMQITRSELKMLRKYFDAIMAGTEIQHIEGTVEIPQRLSFLLDLGRKVKNLSQWTVPQQPEPDTDEGDVEDEDDSKYPSPIRKFDHQANQRSPKVFEYRNGFPLGRRCLGINRKPLSLAQTKEKVREILQRWILRSDVTRQDGQFGILTANALRVLKSDLGIGTIKPNKPNQTPDPNKPEHSPKLDYLTQYEMEYIELIYNEDWSRNYWEEAEKEIEPEVVTTNKDDKCWFFKKNSSKRFNSRMCYDRNNCRPRNFGARRVKDGKVLRRKHAGVDLYMPVGSEVFAIKPGEVILVKSFYCNTFQVVVKNDDGTVIRYGELQSTVAKGIKRGRRVKACQKIGRVGKLSCWKYSMLHLEFHWGGRKFTGKKLGGGLPYKRSSYLRDPTKYIKCLQQVYYDKTLDEKAGRCERFSRGEVPMLYKRRN